MVPVCPEGFTSIKFLRTVTPLRSEAFVKIATSAGQRRDYNSDSANDDAWLSPSLRNLNPYNRLSPRVRDSKTLLLINYAFKLWFSLPLIKRTPSFNS